MQIYNSQSGVKKLLFPFMKAKWAFMPADPRFIITSTSVTRAPSSPLMCCGGYLEHKGYDVTFVQNFTDIDDKMIKRANEEGITVKELGERFIAEYFKDAQALGIRPATVHPKATEHIPQIIALVQRLIDNGHAYAVNGDVYYRVSSFPGYGKLSGAERGGPGNGRFRAPGRGDGKGKPRGLCPVEGAEAG